MTKLRAKRVLIHRTLLIYSGINGCSDGGIIRPLIAPRVLLRFVAGSSGSSAVKIVLNLCWSKTFARKIFCLFVAS